MEILQVHRSVSSIGPKLERRFCVMNYFHIYYLKQKVYKYIYEYISI